MPVVQFEDAVRRNASRLQASAAHLIDDGQEIVRAKLFEASEILHDSFAHLMDDSQEMIRAKLLEAVDLLQGVRRQAAEAAHDTLDQATVQAKDSYDELRSFSRSRPLATAAIAAGVGVALGLALTVRRGAKPTAAPAKPAPKALAAPKASARPAAKARVRVRKPKTDAAKAPA